MVEIEDQDDELDHSENKNMQKSRISAISGISNPSLYNSRLSLNNGEGAARAFQRQKMKDILNERQKDKVKIIKRRKDEKINTPSR